MYNYVLFLILHLPFSLTGAHIRLVDCPETSVRNYYWLRHNPQEDNSQVPQCTVTLFCYNTDDSGGHCCNRGVCQVSSLYTEGCFNNTYAVVLQLPVKSRLHRSIKTKTARIFFLNSL